VEVHREETARKETERRSGAMHGDRARTGGQPMVQDPWDGGPNGR
jgi:hypothetical protein